MFLKNYTSKVPVSETVFNIEKTLLRCGVSGIMKEYGPSANVVALTFRIALEESRPWTIRLPVSVANALNALWLDYVGDDKLSPDGNKVFYNPRKKKKKSDFFIQAERTAWKIMQDWVEVQMTMIVMKQAEWREVFLPYAWDGKRSYFQSVRDSGFAGLLPEKNEPD